MNEEHLDLILKKYLNQGVGVEGNPNIILSDNPILKRLNYTELWDMIHYLASEGYLKIAYNAALMHSLTPKGKFHILRGGLWQDETVRTR